MNKSNSYKLSATDLINLTEALYYEALECNCYRLILLQYPRIQQEHPEAIRTAPAFLQIAYRGMHDALFVNLAKLYDSSRAYSIISLIADLKRNQRLFAEANTDYNAYYKKINKAVTYKLTTSIDEVKTIKTNMSFAEKLRSAIIVNDMFLDNDAKFIQKNMNVSVDLSLDEFIEYFTYRYNALKKSHLKKLRRYRNKALVHNDKELFLTANLTNDEFQFLKTEVEQMIALPLDLTRFTLRYLDGRILGTSYRNIDDLEGLMRIVDIGLKYRDEYVRELCNEKIDLSAKRPVAQTDAARTN